MAKKKEEIIDKSKRLEFGLDELMSDRFGRYSKYIIQERALPDARDGLKPVQRRILYAMWEDGNTFEKAHRKSAKAVGYIIGYYHPHGDTSVYDAIVRLSQNWKMNLPLIDMQGNNGSIDDDPAAAMRYTEARLAKVSATMLCDIDKDSVIFTNNYDDSLLEPTVLPSRFPLLLVNGATGIASGYATNIAPHNLNEVIDATIYRMYNPECEVEDLMNYIKGPDFPTGAIAMGKNQMIEAFKTGKGKVTIRSKTEIVEGRTINQIVITEIPYEVVKVNLVKKMDEIRINKDIDGIVDVRDESGREGLRIVVDVKKDVDTNLILNYLFKNTDLQVNYNYNMIAIVNHRPVLMNLKTCLDAFIEHRKEVVINKTKYLLNKKKERMHIIDGLMKAISIMDDVIEMIRKSNDKADAKRRIKEAFLFTEVQAEAIVSLRLYRLTNTDINILKAEFAELTKEISELEAILASNAILLSVIANELKEIKENYGYERRSEIVDEVPDIVIDKMSMINNEECMITVTKDGYIKRVSMRSYNAVEGQMTGMKDTDKLLGFTKAETLDTLLLFTNKGYYAHLPIYEIDEAKWKDIGKHFSSYVKNEGEEKIVSAIIIKNFDTFAYIVTVSKLGLIKKTLVSDFKLQRYSKTALAMKLDKDDEVIKASVSYEGNDVIVLSKDGYYNRYSLDVISAVSAKSKGVKAIGVKGDEVAGFVVCKDASENVLLVNTDGQLKRVKLEEFTMTSRGTRGNRVFKPMKTREIRLKTILMSKPLDTLTIFNEEISTINAKDVAIMSLDSSFSSPLNIKGEFYIMSDRDSEISTCDIVDFPSDFNKSEESFEQITLL